MTVEQLEQYRDRELEGKQLVAIRAEVHNRHRISRDTVIPEDDQTNALLQFYDQKIRETTKFLAAIETGLDNCQNELYREILRCHYLRGWTWETVSEHITYCFTHTMRLKKLALEAVADL